MAFDPKTKRLFLPTAEMVGRKPKPGTFTVLVVKRQ
jgi:hypothetical protein